MFLQPLDRRSSEDVRPIFALTGGIERLLCKSMKGSLFLDWLERLLHRHGRIDMFQDSRKRFKELNDLD